MKILLRTGRKFRMSLGEVMGVIALVALCCRWPFLVVGLVGFCLPRVLYRLGFTRAQSGAIAMLVLVLGAAVLAAWSPVSYRG